MPSCLFFCSPPRLWYQNPNCWRGWYRKSQMCRQTTWPDFQQLLTASGEKFASFRPQIHLLEDLVQGSRLASNHSIVLMKSSTFTGGFGWKCDKQILTSKVLHPSFPAQKWIDSNKTRKSLSASLKVSNISYKVSFAMLLTQLICHICHICKAEANHLFFRNAGKKLWNGDFELKHSTAHILCPQQARS